MDLTSLITAFGGVTWVIVAFIIALSVIVAVHEYGHYIVGRWTGIHAEVFSLGFGPVLMARTDRRGTKWQVAALPFGGYVKFLGDANAASAGADGEAIEALSQEDRRKTMQGAPLWARSLTVAAGPFFNFIMSAIVFAVFFMVNGEAEDPLRIAELTPMPVASELLVGDELIAVEGIPINRLEEFSAVREGLPHEPLLTYEIRRDGEVMEVLGPHVSPPLVVQVSLESAALNAGIEAGDVVLRIDGRDIVTFGDMVDIVSETQGKALDIDVWRNGEELSFLLEPKATDERQPGGGFVTSYRIGLQGGTFFSPVTQALGPGEAALQALGQVGLIIVSSLDGLWNIITGAISSCNLSGPVGIATTAGTMASFGAQDFIWFIVVLSTAVGLLNLFPIPILDGGHLVFHAYEAVAGRPPSDRALNVLMAVGLALIGTLMIVALGSDFFCP